jgi:hypothetical protein
MDPSLRRVTRLPLTELWNESGSVAGRAVRDDLSEEDLRQLLRRGPVQFVEIRMSEPPSWIPLEERFTFWKECLRPILTQPGPEGRIYTDEFPVYVASEWEVEGSAVPVVVATRWD